MSNTNPIIDNIRKALNRLPNDTVSNKPAILKPRISGSQESELDMLIVEINKLSGFARRITMDQVESELLNLTKVEKITKTLLWDTPWLNQFNARKFLESNNIEIIPNNSSKDKLAQCELGITEADFALPETGTLVLLSSQSKPRTTSLLPRVHLVLLNPQAVVPDLHQVFASTRDNPYTVFITGPSRTSDIELITTLGVHGPKSLYVWIIC